ncbi:hypothetical protein HMPREF0864_00792 [Enterobacteriaceae bacterium 9_2_54FAA]|jgi:hypothetical protein|uniref:phage tail termination protein n=1 Tax=Hafnia paralvei TaxID=546367 RepID=UPI0001F0665B|nr:hypothetical protein [Hafnia paralvei]EFV42463.1 hypothetical protein HMPREF0864_00792 [Enterobacteriaceae bacterium 9_2_54FAA]
MSTPVFIKFREWLEDAGLTDGYKVQMVQWVEQKSDTGNMKYMVFQPDNGTSRVDDIGAEDYVLVIIVGAENDVQPLIQRAQDILDYASQHSDDSCLNAIFNDGGLPTPIPTEDNRMVIRLRFRCVS